MQLPACGMQHKLPYVHYKDQGLCPVNLLRKGILLCGLNRPIGHVVVECEVGREGGSERELQCKYERLSKT